MVTRDQLADREDRMLERLEKMLSKFEGRMEDTLGHSQKVYGHSTADQLQKLYTKITTEQDEKRAAVLKELPPPVTPPKNDLLARWGLPLGVAAVVGGPGTVVQVMNLINALT